jgi:hypothetical protein
MVHDVGRKRTHLALERRRITDGIGNDPARIFT